MAYLESINDCVNEKALNRIEEPASEPDDQDNFKLLNDLIYVLFFDVKVISLDLVFGT